MGIREIFLILVIFCCPIPGLSNSNIKAMIAKAEVRHGLPQGLLTSIVRVESNFQEKAHNSHENPGVAVSSYGLGQLTIATSESHCGLKLENIYDPRKNLDCSARVLKFQLRRYGRDMNKAIAAYQWGTPCMCDGKVYKRQGGKYRVCKWMGSMEPMYCNKKNLFYNQSYVDNVLNHFLFKYHRF